NLSIFASTPITYNLNLTAQLKAASTDTLRDLYGIYKNNTGFKKLFFVPQVSYTLFDKLTIVTTGELPLYQFVNGTQLTSKLFLTGGIIYKFSVKRNRLLKMPESKTDG
ncbi:MAG: hypothetical protein JKX95_02780, partial [Bacteroidia bacterium]|nr:hypothetical protein [Bacteroidia bacterium]